MKPIISKISKYVLCFLLLSIQTVSYGGWKDKLKQIFSSPLKQNTDVIDIPGNTVFIDSDIEIYKNPVSQDPEDLLLAPAPLLPEQLAILQAYMKRYSPIPWNYQLTNNKRAIEFILDVLAVEEDKRIYTKKHLEKVIAFIIKSMQFYPENLSYAQFLFQLLRLRDPTIYTISSKLAKQISQLTFDMMNSYQHTFVFYQYEEIYQHIKSNFIKLLIKKGLQLPIREDFFEQDNVLI